MIGAVRLFLAAALPLALLAPAAADAAPVGPPAVPPGQAQLLRSLTLTKLADMEFGDLGVAGAGTAIINPVTDTLTTTGGVFAVGSGAHAAQFRGVASGNSVVNIRVPTQPVMLTRVGGTETIRLDNFTLDGQSKRAMAQAGVFTFKVGGTLRPTAGQVDGLYTGTFEVTIQYP